MRAFKYGEVIKSPVTGDMYKVADLLGRGGFGAAYRLYLLDKKGNPIEELCLKSTLDSQSWHRESYFGELMRSCDRAIRMYESFPLFPPTKRHDVLYCLVFELAECGTVRDYLESTKRAWSQKRATQEVIALLKVLDHLHGTGALHRDITPLNVFVCKSKRLKLADFGIAKHVLGGRPATASVFNRVFASDKMAKGLQRHWLASDDVYQMGQLLAMLLRADPYTLIGEQDVESLACDEALKAVITRAICPRKTRYVNANEMLRALRGDIEFIQPQVTSLVGKTVVFTGPLSSFRRFDAEVMVRQSGGFITSTVSAKVDVVVQGARSPKYSNGHKGEKLCLAEKLIQDGHKLSIINEQEFLNLVGA